MFVFLLWGAMPLRAEKSAFTLEEAIAKARAENPELAVLEAAVAAARGGVTTARAWGNPTLTLEPGVRRALEEDAFTTGFNGAISLSQPFKFPGKQTLDIAIAQSDVKLRETALEGFRLQMAIRVKRAFYEMLTAQAIAQARTEQTASASAFAESAKKRAEGGYTGDFEVLKSQADLIAAQVAQREAEGQVAQARIELNTLMGRSPAVPLDAKGTIEGLATRGRTADFIALAFAKNPALCALDIEAEKAGLTLRHARRDALPDVSVGPSAEYYKDEQIYSLSISLPLPIWDRGKGGIQTATAQQEQTLAEIRRLRLEIAGGVAKAAAGLDAATNQLALYPSSLLDKMRTFVQQAEEGYARSETTLLIYLDAKSTYFDTLAGYYEALGRVATSRAELESAIGAPLNLLKP